LRVDKTRNPLHFFSSPPQPGDVGWMRRALKLALKAEGRTSPNPLVGAVLVRKGKMLGAGYHHRCGEPHAEIEAIHAARAQRKSLRGATLYVTLEPCSTHGKTPPCTEAILRCGIQRVVVGATDPNPLHAGRGFEILRAAGVEVTSGVLADECTEINRAFNHWITTGRPWVTAKLATSLDGRLARRPGEDRWLSSPESRLKAHELRLRSDAILIGASTLRTDDPALTVRLPAGRMAGKRQPWRVVMTRGGRLPRSAQLFTDEQADRTLVFQKKSWNTVLTDLGRRGVTHLLIEGGGLTVASAFHAGIVNECVLFITPHLLGGKALAWPLGPWIPGQTKLEKMQCQKSGSDLMLHAYVHRTR
jgi:diaminohydroxyphosphoribosylaminopyrimidine deaminase/5-amino-6-(5-phosphoribosylamino)uracil reductase